MSSQLLFQFWDNLIYHYKNLYPMYDKKVDFKQYIRYMCFQRKQAMNLCSVSMTTGCSLKPET